MQTLDNVLYSSNSTTETDRLSIVTPWSTVGLLTYKRTYARKLTDDDTDSRTEEWHDTIERVIRGANEQLNCGFTDDEQQRLYGYLKRLKGSVAGRFLWQLGTPFVSKHGLASLQNCFGSETRVVTDKGVKSLESLVGQDVKFLHKGDMVAGTVKEFGVQGLYDVTFKVPGRSNHRLRYRVTKNHRWELTSGEITTELKVGDKVPLTAYDNRIELVEYFARGLVFGDGSHHYRYSNGDYGHSIRLCGSKEEYKDYFKHYSYQPNCNGDPVAYVRSSENYKELPTNLPSPDAYASFIDGWLAADGSVNSHGHITLSSQHEGAYQYLVDHAAYAGYVVTGVNYNNRPTNFGERTAPLAKISLSRLPNLYMQVESMEYNSHEKVYCAVVPDVERFTLAGGLTTSNCAFTTVDHSVRPFTWAFDMLMLGSGVGYNIQREYVYKLPPVSENFTAPVRLDEASADFIIPDTRQGWVELLRRTLESGFGIDGASNFSYSTQLVRGKGVPIKGFGGVASGPEDLCWGIGEISRILERRKGEQLRPIDCLDIMNIIGQVVVSGNVRRSAQIAIGDHDDIQFLRAKRWDLGGVPNWRSMSNNSVVCNNFSLLPEEFWEGYKGNGEPYGLINLRLSRSGGRTGETQYPDKRIRGYNPCAEQGLEDYETCCLAEIFLPNIDSNEELLDVAKLLYRINKHSLSLPCHHKETEAVVHRNMRMGIGVTGYLQATEEQREWLRDAYDNLREFDKEYSKARSFPPSIKLTTVKPSGTLSLLPGVTPGAHPAYANYLIRRIRISSNSPLVEACRRHGYKVEFQKNFDGTEDYSTYVVEFPFSYPEGTKIASEMSAIDQLEVVRRLQTEWSDNSVSCTVYYRPEELEGIKDYLAKNYNKNFKSLSFLLHSEHGFIQAPLEEITEEQFNEMVANTTIITDVREGVDFEGDADCIGGMCPVK